MEKIPPRYVLERIFKNARKHTFLNKRMVFVYINPFYIPSHTSSRTKHTFRIPPRDDTHSARTTHTPSQHAQCVNMCESANRVCARAFQSTTESLCGRGAQHVIGMSARNARSVLIRTLFLFIPTHSTALIHRARLWFSAAYAKWKNVHTSAQECAPQ